MKFPQEKYIVDSDRPKTAVILTIEQYEQLLEDLHDLAIVAERRSEQSMSLAAIKAKLNHGNTHKDLDFGENGADQG